MNSQDKQDKFEGAPSGTRSGYQRVHPEAVPPRRSLLGRFMLWIGRHPMAVRLDLQYLGQENIPSDTNFIIAPNHQSYLDGMWTLNGMSRKDREATCVMVGADLKDDYGFVGKMLYYSARPIAVERKGNPVRSLIKAKNALLEGENVLIHPEGTRSPDGRLAELHNGAAWLSHKCRVPILPVYLDGAYEIWPRQKERPSFRDPESGKKRRLRVHYLPVIQPWDFDSQDDIQKRLLEALTEAETKALAQK